MAGLRIKGGLTFWHSGQRFAPVTGTPEGALVAPKGSLAVRSDGSAVTGLYQKKSGTGSTGWAPMAAVSSITRTFLFSDMTDGGSTDGTLVLADTIPAGAIVIGSLVIPTAGFAGDTTAVLKIGDGSTAARFNKSAGANVFATSATAVDSGPPSGVVNVGAAATVTITVTSATDFTAVNAGTVSVTIFFINTI